MVVLVTCKNEDPIKNKGAGVVTTLFPSFSDAQLGSNVFYWRQIFALDSVVFKTQNGLAPMGLLTNAM